nr:uncharacterized protein LOC122270719 [Parasteatoda tepidariorum]
MKKMAQKNKAADKVELYKTGGGGSMLKTTPMDEKFLAIGIVTNPLEEDIDCDSEYNNFIKDSQAQKENSSEAITFEYNRTEDVIDSEEYFPVIIIFLFLFCC